MPVGVCRESSIQQDQELDDRNVCLTLTLASYVHGPTDPLHVKYRVELSPCQDIPLALINDRCLYHASPSSNAYTQHAEPPA